MPGIVGGRAIRFGGGDAFGSMTGRRARGGRGACPGSGLLDVRETW